MALSRRSILLQEKIIYVHHLKSTSPSILTKSTVLFPFPHCYSSQVFLRLASTSHRSGSTMLGCIVCSTGDCRPWLATSMPAAFHPTGEGQFCPWKSVPLISDSQAVVFSDTVSEACLFMLVKWANTFQVATTGSTLPVMDYC